VGGGVGLIVAVVGLRQQEHSIAVMTMCGERCVWAQNRYLARRVFVRRVLVVFGIRVQAHVQPVHA
jgi:hypothetical protein